MKILVFDTETTDLPPTMPGATWEQKEEYGKKLLSFRDLKKKSSTWSQYIADWPHIIQLSYIVYNTDKPKKSKIFSKYIELPDEVEVSENSMEIHNISKETISSANEVDRAKIYDALAEFMTDVERADVVVGHNVQFDRKMIVAELLRLEEFGDLSAIRAMMNNRHFKCTMEITRPICKLKKRYVRPDSSRRRTTTDSSTTDSSTTDSSTMDYSTTDSISDVKEFYKFKSPKLIEAYRHFFGYDPNPAFLHDALVDVVICLRVFCMTLDQGFDVCGTNPDITDIIVKISPNGYACDLQNAQQFMYDEWFAQKPSLLKKTGTFKTRKTTTKTANNGASASTRSRRTATKATTATKASKATSTNDQSRATSSTKSKTTSKATTNRPPSLDEIVDTHEDDVTHI